MLITGAAGLVGQATCAELAKRGWKVHALVRDPEKSASRLAHLHVEFRVGDIRDPVSLDRALVGVGTVVHLAAIAIERKGESYTSTNTDATRNVIDAAIRAGATRLVHMSQNGASSTSPYVFLRSKGIAQDIVTSSSLEWTVIRPSVIFGPADEFVNVLARLALLSPMVFPLPGGGTARFQPIAVGDVAKAVAAILEKKSAVRQSYAIGGPEPLSLRDMSHRILAAMQIKRILVPLPVSLLRPVVAVLQRLLPNPPVTSSLLDLLAVDNTVPENAIESELGITPLRFDSESLGYLKRITRMEALGSLFRRH
ncbi:MAG: complex I NDUFA9 subunit family protein [Gemmatimonadaceae bacterium]|nr:complex I NDUFA9 subunit family protein [Gemmatimonadaceae bacterium]